MEKEEVQERIKAISYLLENDMIHEDAVQEAEEELYELSNADVKVKEDVTNPQHYKIGIEVYDKIAKNKDAYHGFLHLNATKYLHRVFHKHDTPFDDLNKSKWYIDKLIEDLKC